MRIGVDVGGTFTDVVLYRDDATSTQPLVAAKALTTHGSLADGVMDGIAKVLEMTGAQPADITGIVHGTTIGTNALIERAGAKTALLTTAGFRDVLEIGRVQRPPEGLYDFTVDNPLPLVPRYLRLDIPERVDRTGAVITPLDEQAVRDAGAFLKREQVEAVAVCYLFGFLHPAHEHRTREILREVLPGVPVSLASEIAPEFREFERTSTVVINSYLTPTVRSYLESLDNRVQEFTKTCDLRIVQASGGTMTVKAALDRVVLTVNSGPAGGATAAGFFSKLTGMPKLISVDMGGTSFDIGIILDSKPALTSEGNFEGFPVKIQQIDVHAIGAGGGSIAWIDRGGALNVGPQSARSKPGPACYGRGGTKPTVTDANLVLGRLDPNFFLGGAMTLDVEKARAAVEADVAKPMGMSIEDAALGIIALVNANMVKGINTNSIERALDIREFGLVAFGGAGAVHAVELGRDAGVKQVLVPPLAGNLSATGLLVADTRLDRVRTVMWPQSQVDPQALYDALKALDEEAITAVRAQRVPEDRISSKWIADCRFQGQSYELGIELAHTGKTFTQGDVTALIANFNATHERLYHYGSVDEQVEIVNLRVTAIGASPAFRLPPVAKNPGGADAAGALKGKRPVHFARGGAVETAIYDRTKLGAGARFAGPCLVEETLTTTVVPPGATVEVDPHGTLVIGFAPA
jgi:N-methylhydantoinase A